MPVKPLRNSDWGFDSLCFVCDPGNERGIQVPFSHDEERGRVVASLNLPRPYSGAPNYVHGGAIGAVLDEAMAWAVIALLQRFGVTRRYELAFKKPLLIGTDYKVEAWIEEHEDRKVTARAEIRDASGDLYSEASGKYWVMDKEEAARAIGELKGEDRSYVVE